MNFKITGKWWIALAAFCSLAASAATAQSMKIPKPSEGLMPNPARGKSLFTANCASCHGADLKGSAKGPPMLHKVYEPSHHSDAAFQLAVKQGVRAHHWQFGDMPPVPGLSPDDVAHITAFIRLEQRKTGIQ
ncbi:MAG TPA: cytochrome c [Noviherbaspirillum sp.]|nr:cytochrome c [Noviherbaspirillum sp.]